MHRIDLFSICEKYNDLMAVYRLEDSVLDFELFWAMVEAIRALELLFSNDEIPIRLSSLEGRELQQGLNALTMEWQEHLNDTDEELRKRLGGHLGSIKWRAEKFFNAFEIELRDFHTYLLPDIGLFGINRLMEAGAVAFNPDTKLIIGSNVLMEVREAGRSLAFGLHTASGYHILRAAEMVIWRYMDHVGRPLSSLPKKSHNWGAYVKILRSATKANQKIVNHIYEIKEYHRNPIIHPEETLSENQAKSLLSVCETLIQSIADEMPGTITLPKP